MTSVSLGRPVKGVVCLGQGWWCRVVVGRTIAGLSGYAAHARQRCRPGHTQTQRAGYRGGALI
jgi:hypothetical protein